MALPNLKDQNIQDTYQRVIQTDGTSIADGTGSLLPISFDGNNVIISGSLSATEYTVTSSVTNVVFQQQSGSTIFGDSNDDTHVFTGSLDISGSVTATSFTGISYCFSISITLRTGLLNSKKSLVSSNFTSSGTVVAFYRF